MAYMYLQQTQGKPVGINRQRREISRWGNYGSSTPFMKGSNKKKKKKNNQELEGSFQTVIPIPCQKKVSVYLWN